MLADRLAVLAPRPGSRVFLTSGGGDSIEAGVLPPPAGYLEGVEDLCRRHGILTIADVVICGFGRLGEWLGVERFGLLPDLIVFAKGVTSGYLPLGGVIAAPSVAEPFWEGGRRFAHGATHAACCAAALANLDLLPHWRTSISWRATISSIAPASSRRASISGSARSRPTPSSARCGEGSG